jgi:serine/threonine protein kinase
MAMQFLDGPTLRDALRDGPMDPARAAALIRKIGEALAAVHSHGIVHRDFKPENVILMGDEPIVIDFGSAGMRSAENELAETMLMAGSFHYMAPERLMRRYSAASDVFSFAVVILEMVGGKRLADLRSMYNDETFVDELSLLLRNPDAAEKLAPAFDPEPRKRPGPVDVWANLVAAALVRRVRAG